jgi:isochorismate synthase
VSDRVSDVYSLTRPVPVAMLDADWLSNRDRDVFVWEQPSGHTRIIGLGASVVHFGQGPDRFAAMGAAVDTTFARIRRLDTEGPGPRFVGGFGFVDHDPAPDGHWAGFPAACMVLPEICVLETGGRAWAIATTPGEDLSEEDARRHLGAALDRLTFAPPGSAEPAPVAVSLDEGSSRYRDLVAAAASEIAAGSFQKLVVARTVDAATAANPDRVLDALRARYPGCVTYAVTSGDKVFIGATPEPLVLRNGRAVSSVALAGTIARGADPAADDDLAARLMADPKEREEHQHVVAGIRQSLEAMGVRLRPPADPTVRKLATVQHLETRISGNTDAATSLIDLAGALHPTPAVGGLPEEGAVDWIAGHEGLERGWYAAPIGFVTADGDGEFHVALRCALLEGGIARCFVGAGIVAGSDPDRELAETTAKLRAIAGSLAG